MPRMSEPIDPERSEVERNLWHTLDEAGWSADQIRESFTAYRSSIFREEAAKIRDEHASELAKRQREAIPEIMEREQGYLHQDLLTELTDLIDPRMK
jgi:broad-specificity NMP kinase